MEASHGHPKLQQASSRRNDGWFTHLMPSKGAQHRWIVVKLVNDVVMSGAQTLVVKSELRGIQGLEVMPEGSPVVASVVNAVIERSVW